MTKKHFQQMAEIVHAILYGCWTDEPPYWADPLRGDWQSSFDATQMHYTRAVQTAEAFIVVCREFNPRFDEQQFLVACGLADAPPKRGTKGRTR